eukprot:604521-Rhodomonas_salina.2
MCGSRPAHPRSPLHPAGPTAAPLPADALRAKGVRNTVACTACACRVQCGMRRVVAEGSWTELSGGEERSRRRRWREEAQARRPRPQRHAPLQAPSCKNKPCVYYEYSRE